MFVGFWLCFGGMIRELLWGLIVRKEKEKIEQLSWGTSSSCMAIERCENESEGGESVFAYRLSIQEVGFPQVGQ